MAHYTVDQAGRIEYGCDTVISLCSREFQYALKVTSSAKREIFSMCNKSKKNNLTIRLFAYSLALLLKNRVSKHDLITIDCEYPGHEADIKNLLLQYLPFLYSDHIHFSLLGKKDDSHRIANHTFNSYLKPTEIVYSIRLSDIVPRKLLKEYLK